MRKQLLHNLVTVGADLQFNYYSQQGGLFSLALTYHRYWSQEDKIYLLSISNPRMF